MRTLILAVVISLASTSYAADLKLNDPAPDFVVKDQNGKEFILADRQGKWTVLYFFPKAETPGCTAQACAFRDNIKKIRDQGAEVYGISIDSVKNLADFHKKHSLNFPLLADEKGVVANIFGSKMPIMRLSKRWTFLIDPKLKIKHIEKDVDPALDAQKVANILSQLKI